MAVDLAADWPEALRGRGFVAGAATLWLVEGLLVHPTSDQVATLMARMDALSGGGSIALLDAVVCPAAKLLFRASRRSQRPQKRDSASFRPMNGGGFAEVI